MNKLVPSKEKNKAILMSAQDITLLSYPVINKCRYQIPVWHKHGYSYFFYV